MVARHSEIKHISLPKDRVANMSQIITIDKSFLASKVAKLPPGFVQRIEEGLRLVFSL